MNIERNEFVAKFSCSCQRNHNQHRCACMCVCFYSVFVCFAFLVKTIDNASLILCLSLFGTSRYFLMELLFTLQVLHFMLLWIGRKRAKGNNGRQNENRASEGICFPLCFNSRIIVWMKQQTTFNKLVYHHTHTTTNSHTSYCNLPYICALCQSVTIHPKIFHR